MSSGDAPRAQPGWYDDPAGGDGKRYWDGVAWTDDVPPTAGRNPWTVGCLGLVAIVVLVSVLGGVFGGDDSGDGGVEGGGGRYGAEDVCEQFVENRLKSPGSADFSDTEAATGSGDVWTVSGAVDSENSFGGLVRNTYVCEVRHTTGENWTLVDLQMTAN